MGVRRTRCSEELDVMGVFELPPLLLALFGGTTFPVGLAGLPAGRAALFRRNSECDLVTTSVSR